MFVGSCLPSALPPSDVFIVEVTPTQATVQVGGTLVLTGNATGFADYKVAQCHQWWMQEEYHGPGTLDAG
jgi:hypothetical protein